MYLASSFLSYKSAWQKDKVTSWWPIERTSGYTRDRVCPALPTLDEILSLPGKVLALSNLHSQTKMAHSIKAAPSSRASARGQEAGPQERWPGPALGGGARLSAEEGGGALRPGARAAEVSAASAGVRLSRTCRTARVGGSSLLSPSRAACCWAFSDCKQVSIQRPTWGKMPLFPSSSALHSLGRVSVYRALRDILILFCVSGRV